MTRLPLLAAASVAAICTSCGTSTAPPRSESSAPKPKTEKVKITQFYSATPSVAKGMTAQLCYGVEGAKDVDLSPPVEKLWPAVSRCFDVKPEKKTEYTLKAVGDDGSTDTKTVAISVGAAAPRLYDLWVNSLDVKAGQPVQVCFKTENTKRVTASAGKLDTAKNCVNDNPMKTTTYRLTAIGGDNEVDTGTVTVKVHP